MPQPRPLTIPQPPEIILSEVGNILEGEGVKVMIGPEHLVFMAAFDGTEVMLKVSTFRVLDAIQTVTAGAGPSKES